MLPNPKIRAGSLVRLKGQKETGVVEKLMYSVGSPYGKALVNIGSFTMDFPIDLLELVSNENDGLFE